MGIKFRRSVKIAPGVRLNVTKNGINSVSVGGKGLTTNISKKGTRTTVGLPGTGISHSTYKPHAQKPQPYKEDPSYKTQPASFKEEWENPVSRWIMILSMFALFGMLIYALVD